MKLLQKDSFGSEVCEIGPKVAIWGIRRTGFPPEDSPLCYRAFILTKSRNLDVLGRELAFEVIL